MAETMLIVDIAIKPGKVEDFKAAAKALFERIAAAMGDVASISSLAATLPEDHPDGELYDMRADPSEKNNLWNDRQDVVRKLIDLLAKYRKDGRSVPADS